MKAPRTAYATYKSDTSQISTWLAKAALERGYSLAGFQSAPEGSDNAKNEDEDQLEEDPLEEDPLEENPLKEDAGELQQRKKTALRKKNARKNAAKKAKERAQRQGEDGSKVETDTKVEVAAHASIDAAPSTDEPKDPDAAPSRSVDAAPKSKVETDAKVEATPHGSIDAAPRTAESKDAETTPPRSVNAMPKTAQPEVLSGGYTISVSEYVKIARFLVEEGIDIPVELLRILRRCIKLRINALMRFLPKADLSTVTHLHFINVLREVGFVLQEARDAADFKTSNKKGKSSTTPIGDLAADPAASINRFAELNTLVEETDETADDDIQVPEPKTPAGASVVTGKAKFDNQDSKEEVILDFIAFFADLHKMRDYIKSVWVKYRREEIDLVTAALVTDTAMELFKRPCEDMMRRSVPTLGSNLAEVYDQVFSTVRERFTTSSETQPLDSSESTEAAWQTIGLYDHFLWMVLRALKLIVQTIATDPHHTLSQTAVYSATSVDIDLDVQSVSCRMLHSFMRVLGTYSLNMAVISLQLAVTPPELPLELDQMPRSLYDAGGEPTLWSLFAVQVWVDIVSSLRDCVARGREELLRNAKRMKASFDAIYDQYTEAAYDRPWIWTEPLASASEGFQILLDEEIRILTGQSEQDDYWGKSEQDDYWGQKKRLIALLMHRDPLACGLKLHRLRTQHQELSRTIAESLESGLITAYLHHACRNFSSYDPQEYPRWHDMELYLDLTGQDYIFAGKVPESFQDAFISLSKMQGASLQTLRELRAKEGAVQFRARGVSKTAGKDQGYSVSRSNGLAALRPLLNKKLGLPPGAGPEPRTADLSTLELFLQERLVRAHIAVRKKAGLPREQRPRRQFSHQELLAEMERAMKAESVSFKFDYAYFHFCCLHVIRRICEGLAEYPGGDKIIRDIDLRDWIEASQLPDVAFGIMELAAGHARDTHICVGQCTHVRRSALHVLSLCARFMSEAIRELELGEAEPKQLDLLGLMPTDDGPYTDFIYNEGPVPESEEALEALTMLTAPPEESGPDELAH